MKIAHYIKITVFVKPEDDEDKINNKLLDLIPFNLEKEKVELKQTKAKGFNEREINIFEINLVKDKHIELFLGSLINNLSKEAKELILKQADSRIDQDCNFFLRLSKDKLINANEYWITDQGNCFHIKVNIAAFPKKKEKALEIIDKIFQ